MRQESIWPVRGLPPLKQKDDDGIYLFDIANHNSNSISPPGLI